MESGQGGGGKKVEAKMESVRASSVRDVKWRSKDSWAAYLSLRKGLENTLFVLVNREKGHMVSCFGDLVYAAPIRNIIADAADNIREPFWKAFASKKYGLPLKGEADELIDYKLEVLQLCERIFQEFEDVLHLCQMHPYEHDDLVTPILRKICRDTMSFCASHGKLAPVLKKSQAVPVLEERQAVPVLKESQAVPVLEERQAVPVLEERQAVPVLDGEKVEAKMESVHASSAHEVKWRSKDSLAAYLALRKCLENTLFVLVNREMGDLMSCFDDLVYEAPIRNIIEDAVNNIREPLWKAFWKKYGLRERDPLKGEANELIGFKLEVLQFCERVFENFEDVLHLCKINPYEHDDLVTPILLKICRDTMSFCASHGKLVTVLKESQAVPELDSGNKGPAVEGRVQFINETEEKTEEPSHMLEVERQGMVVGDKFSNVQALLDRVEVTNETDEEKQDPSDMVEVERQGMLVRDTGEHRSSTTVDLERQVVVCNPLEVEGQVLVGREKFPEESGGPHYMWNYYDTNQEGEIPPEVEAESTTNISPSDDTEDEKPDAAYEEEAFARYREGWEGFYGNSNTFEELTLFSPMIFTHCTPGFIPVDATLAKTVQICSIKVAVMENFKWPLEIYGVVAARDSLDKRRNPVFLRSREDCQVIDEKDPFLHLTGPVRAILSEEPVDIEIQLSVKGTTPADDRPFISYAFYYKGDNGPRVRNNTIEKYSCTLVLCTQQVDLSVQATIFAFRIVDDKLNPFEHGFKVVCSSQRGTENRNEPEIVLFDSKIGCAMKNGFLNLSRQIIAVELHGKMKIRIQAYSQSGDVAVESSVLVVPKKCNTSQHELDLAGFKVVFTVAWSLLVEDEDMILMNGMVDPYAVLPPMPPSLLKENGGIF